MNARWRLTIRPFAGRDAPATATLLRAASPDYVRYFHPFDFEAAAIGELASRAVRDQWFALELEGDAGRELAGIYLLRGLDEGFPEPMYAIFVAERFSGRGLARLTLAHAEAQARLNEWPALLLKVDPQNARAFRLYEASGFRFLRPDSATGQHVLKKPLPIASPSPL